MTQNAPPSFRPAGSPACTPAGNSSGRTSRIMAWRVIAIVALVVAAGLAFGNWRMVRAARDARRVNAEFQRTNADSLLMTQQLDEIFQHVCGRITQSREVTPEDAELLKTWARYDEQFIFQGRGHPETRFPQAIAHRRLGLVGLMFGRLDEAEDHYRQAIDLLQELASEQPAVNSYRSESADTYLRLAWLAQAQGNPVSIDEATRQVVLLVGQLEMESDPESMCQCATILHSLGQLEVQRRRAGQARPLLERSAALYRRLLQESPEMVEFQAQLEQVQRLLETSGE